MGSSILEALAAGFGRGLREVEHAELKHEKDKFARERNLLAVALAARNSGFGGYYFAEDSDDYPVVWAELPNLGEDVDERFDRDERLQVSWHVDPTVAELVESELPNEEPPRGWDGHDRAEKNQRLVEFVERA